MPARSAICATSTISLQRAGQRSGTRVSARPPSELAENTPSLNLFGPRIGCGTAMGALLCNGRYTGIADDGRPTTEDGSLRRSLRDNLSSVLRPLSLNYGHSVPSLRRTGGAQSRRAVSDRAGGGRIALCARRLPLQLRRDRRAGGGGQARLRGGRLRPRRADRPAAREPP